MPHRLRPAWQQFPQHRRSSLKQAEAFPVGASVPSHVLDALEADLDGVDVKARSSVLPVQNRFSVLNLTVRDINDDFTHTALDPRQMTPRAGSHRAAVQEVGLDPAVSRHTSFCSREPVR